MKFEVDMEMCATRFSVILDATSIQDAAIRLTDPSQRVERVRPVGGEWVRVLVDQDGHCNFPRL